MKRFIALKRTFVSVRGNVLLVAFGKNRIASTLSMTLNNSTTNIKLCAIILKRSFLKLAISSSNTSTFLLYN